MFTRAHYRQIADIHFCNHLQDFYATIQRRMMDGQHSGMLSDVDGILVSRQQSSDQLGIIITEK